MSIMPAGDRWMKSDTDAKRFFDLTDTDYSCCLLSPATDKLLYTVPVDTPYGPGSFVPAAESQHNRQLLDLSGNLDAPVVEPQYGLWAVK